jgi:hypothetical protein
MPKQKDAAEQVARAAMAAFEPIVRLFLDLGVSSTEAEILMRAVYVHETHRLLRERNPDAKEVSHSKVAMLSGVHRNKVQEILSGGSPKIPYAREKWANRAGRILQAWHSDPDYLDEEGSPRTLPVRDVESSTPTFWTLCTKHWPSTWPATLLEELVRIKAVRRRQKGKEESVEVLRHAYGRGTARVEALEEFGARTRDLLSTLIHNLDTPSQGRRVVETIENANVDPEWAKVLRRMFKDRAAAHTSSINSELNSVLAKGAGSKDERPLRMGMTIYAFEGPAPTEENTNKKKPPHGRARNGKSKRSS